MAFQLPTRIFPVAFCLFFATQKNPQKNKNIMFHFCTDIDWFASVITMHFSLKIIYIFLKLESSGMLAGDTFRPATNGPADKSILIYTQNSLFLGSALV